jgi:heptosyltransferase II
MIKILIIAPNWIGDAVMTLPLLDKIKLNNNYNDDITIDVVCSNIIAPIYQHSSSVNNVIIYNGQHNKINFISRVKFALQLKQSNYTHAYILPNSIKSAIIPWIARIKNRIAYSGEFPRVILLTKYIKTLAKHKRKDKPMLEHYYDLAGSSVESPPYPKLNMKLNTSLGLSLSEEYICLAIGAEYGPAKQWPLEHFSALIKLVHEHKPDMQIVILGSNKDCINAEKILSTTSVGYIKNLCGKTTLAEAMHIISKAHTIVTHDSGLMHIAAAIGTPIVAIYGSSSPIHTPPLHHKAKYIWLNIECSPCFARECKFGHYNCLQNITPDHVFEKIFKLC